MYKLLGVTLAIVGLSAAACPGSNAAPTLTATGGATFALVDSVTHGGGDLKLAKTVDTAIVVAVQTLSSPAASSGSTSTTSGTDACVVRVEHDPNQNPQVYTVITSCERK
jgi:hypothetical protein